MALPADVIIVGGGIMGVSLAWRLAAARAGKVVLLEKSHLGAGSTGKSGAILRQHYSHETTVGMARESLAAYAAFAETTGRDIGFRRPGMILMAGAGERSRLEANVQLQRGLGVDARVVSAGDLRELAPLVRFEDDAVGAFEPEAGTVDPVRTVFALGDVAREAGATIHLGSEVKEILHRSGRVVGVGTADGTVFEAPVVINCGGPWARRLMDALNIAVPLEVVRPQQAWMVAPPGVLAEPKIFADVVTGLYWKPEVPGMLRVGDLGYEHADRGVDPDHYDEGVGSGFLTDVRARLIERVPAYAHAVSHGGCGALYTLTPDAQALIGEIPTIRGLYLVAGFSGHGFKLGPAVARGVCAQILGGQAGAFDPAFFALDRFSGLGGAKPAYAYGILG